MRWIVEWSLRTKSLVLGVACLVFLFGVLKLRNVPVDTLPEFSTTYVEIQTEALGLSADEVEQLITLGLEADLLNGVPWLKTIQSQSIDGLSSIRLVFEPGTDLMAARQMVQERLTQAHYLPNVSLPPVMLPPLSSTSRVMAIGLTSRELSTVQLSILARWTVRPRLMGVPGVANVSVWGLRDRELQVRVNPQDLKIRSTTLNEVIRSTGEALWESPLSYLEASTPGTGGWIETPNQRLGVRHVLPIVTSADLAKVTLEDSDGTLRALGKVADVVEDHQPLIGDAIINGQPGLLLVVERFPWGNTLEVTRGVDEALEALKFGLTGVEVDSHIFRPATFINAAVDNISWALLAACILMIAALFAFLYEWRVALISLVAISLSLVTAVLVLYLLGTTMNIMVLAGLVIALGAVVDDTIIDAEYIAQRLREVRETGDPHSTASIIIDASLEARSPIIYATLIALFAIVPVFFLAGLTGALFQPLAVSYAVALLASLLVAVTVTPVLSLMLLDRVRRERRQSPLAEWLARRHGAALTRIVRWPVLAYVVVGLITLAGIAALPFLRGSMLPVFKERDVLMHWAANPGTSLPEMDRIVARVSNDLASVPGVTRVSGSLGRAVTSQLVAGPYEGQLWINVDPAADYEATLARINKVASDYPGIVHDLKTYLQDNVKQKVAETPDQITIRVYGAEEPILRDKALEVATMVKRVPGVASALVDPTLEAPGIEIETDLEKAEEHGLKPGDVRRAASTLLGRIQVGSLFQDQKVFNVVVWGKPEVRDSLSSVKQLWIDTPNGGGVRLGDIANVRIKPADLVINRDAVSRYVDVAVTPVHRDVGVVQKDVEKALLQLKLPMEYHVEVLGEGGEWRARWRLIGPLVATTILVFLFLQAALSSWRLAALVVLTLPAALAGGILTAALGGSAMSLVTLMGLLAVFGITVRNAISVLRRAQDVDPAGRGESARTIMLEGARDLAAPIVGSTLITAAALIPFVLAGNVPGLEILHSLAAVILGGLVSSTLLTLFILPVICANMDYSGETDPLVE